VALVCAGGVSFPAHAQESVYDDQGKRNPFIPLLTQDGRAIQPEKKKEVSAEGALSLEGIIYDKYDLSYAIVNGEVVKIGDEVGGYQILSIEQDRVVFIRGGQTKVITLQKED